MCYPVNSIFSILRAILYEKEYIFVYLDTFSESLVSAGFRNTNLATKKILRLWEYNVAITDHSQTIRKTIAGCDCPGNEKYYVITINITLITLNTPPGVAKISCDCFANVLRIVRDSGISL